MTGPLSSRGPKLDLPGQARGHVKILWEFLNYGVCCTLGAIASKHRLRSAGTRRKIQIIAEDSGYRCAKQERRGQADTVGY